MARKRIGELLLERRAISADQLATALTVQKRTRERLGIILISQGFLSEDQLATTLAEALQVPRVALQNLTPEWAAIHLLRPRFCETNQLFPLGIEAKGATRKTLTVAMVDPLNGAAIQEMEFTTGLPVSPRLATLSEVRRAILRFYYKVNADLGDGKMTLVQKGGGTRVVDTDAPADGPIVVGREVDKAKATPQKTERATAATPQDTVSKDLAYLTGQKNPEEELEKLERKFWALMRIMARKGLISKDEFRQELDDAEE